MCTAAPAIGRTLVLRFWLAAALVALLMISTASWSDSCVNLSLTSSSITCTIPEQTPETALTVTLTGLSFGAQAQGVVLIYDDATHTLLSDAVAFVNTPAGVATVVFASDTEGVVLPPGLPVIGTFTESKNPIFISVALGNGQFLRAKICSDLAEESSCSGGSDSIGMSVGTSAVPEPGTLLLVASGLISGAWGLRGPRGRRLLRLAKL